MEDAEFWTGRETIQYLDVIKAQAGASRVIAVQASMKMASVATQGFHTCVGSGGEMQTPEWYMEQGIEDLGLSFWEVLLSLFIKIECLCTLKLWKVFSKEEVSILMHMLNDLVACTMRTTTFNWRNFIAVLKNMK
ncbi:uncharacterized protein LOC109835662 isoform X4 [Asparagus officinalis]|uniref:uncharacterized protein LOC109835662 isoform X4 n=1 Tax=Asparagus officinalis TaxID=4686 RepID=UPI00098DEDC6|nr:uncharacterized protein LOC109835662 isoform X4 [Asparagus officinalis]